MSDDHKPRPVGASVELFATVLSTVAGVLAMRGRNCQIDAEAMNTLTRALGRLEQSATPLEGDEAVAALAAYRKELDRQIADVDDTPPAHARRRTR